MDVAERVVSESFEYQLGAAEFERLRKLVLDYTGILLAPEKQPLVYSRFAKRLRALGLRNFEQYIALVEAADSEEMPHFVSAITTNFTSFFREQHHFDYLAQWLAELPRQQRRLRIWSAGCSSGEEPYSIAITLLESIANIEQWDIKILATDLDSQVLARAQQGVYDVERVSGLDEARIRRWFQKGVGGNAGKVRVAAAPRELISFKPLNLLQDWPLKGPFDLIFCRNVIIYFGKDTQRKLFARFADKQSTGGKLCIGHSENLMGVCDRYRLIGKTIYEQVK